MAKKGEVGIDIQKSDMFGLLTCILKKRKPLDDRKIILNTPIFVM